MICKKETDRFTARQCLDHSFIKEKALAADQRRMTMVKKKTSLKLSETEVQEENMRNNLRKEVLNQFIS